MRFSPLPPGTTTIVVIVITLLLVWVAWGSFKYPEALWAPGNLSRYHADISVCSNCHQPFQGAAAKKCALCHDDVSFASRSRPNVSEFHQKTISEGKPCKSCHTEHRGALAQITIGAMMDNPHGEFVFRATGTNSCSACHDFSADLESRAHLLDNSFVRHLMKEGEGAHRQGKMARCLKCHTDGCLETEEEDDE